MKMTCPACGALHEWRVPLPLASSCGNCKSTFSPAEEVQRFAVHICKPGEADTFLESHYSARTVMLPGRGNAIRSPYVKLKKGESLSAVDLEFEFSAGGNGHALSQSVYVLTEVRNG